MNINMDMLLDYLACSQLFKHRHVDKLDVSINSVGGANPKSIDEAYDRALHKTMTYLFHRLQDGVEPNLSMLQKRWGYLWVKPRSDQQDIRFKETSWRDRHDRLRRQGWDQLVKAFHHYREAGWMEPILVDYRYRVPLGRHMLEGVVDLVRVVKDERGRKKIEMTEFLTDAMRAPFVHIRRDWRVTAASYAARYAMNANEEKIVYHGIVSGKFQETERTPHDHKQLEHLLDQIEVSLREKIYYPRFDTRCLTCPYQKPCEKEGLSYVEDQER